MTDHADPGPPLRVEFVVRLHYGDGGPGVLAGPFHSKLAAAEWCRRLRSAHPEATPDDWQVVPVFDPAWLAGVTSDVCARG